MITYLANCDQYLGGAENFLEWALQEFRYVDNSSAFIYKKMANDAYKNSIHKTAGRSYVQMNISYGDSAPEQVLIELFDDIAPKTCANFKGLCTGHAQGDATLSYAKTLFTRIVKGKYI